MGILGGGPLDDDNVVLEPLSRSTHRPPKVWGVLQVDGDSLAVRLSGWRALWAVQRRVRVPIASVIRASHEPGVYQLVSIRLRQRRRNRTTLFKLGSQHGQHGWSFWACGFGRNAVLVETVGTRYRYLVVEVAEPEAVAASIREAAGLNPPATAPPHVGDGTAAGSTQRSPKPASDPWPVPSRRPTPGGLNGSSRSGNGSAPKGTAEGTGPVEDPPAADGPRGEDA